MAEYEKNQENAAYPAEKARQGEIILKTRPRRLIFFAGLIGFVLLAIIIRVIAFG